MRGWCFVVPCVVGLLFASAGCGEEKKPVEPAVPIEQQRMSIEWLKNPENCKGCHPQHYREWASSMHAYSSDDPVFIAMNKRGQRETDGEMGEFCVQCHAPIAFRDGLTTDGLNVAELPRPAKGVTCYFCHNAVEAGPTLVNADVKLANDRIMRGNLRNAVDPGVHGVMYSESHDSVSMKSSNLCGSCHDVVNQHDAHIETTLAEYAASVSSLALHGKDGGDSCQGCHMKAGDTEYVAEGLSAPLAAMLKKRVRHSHRFAAVDVALTDFPDREAQKKETECALTTGAFIFNVVNDGQGNFDIGIETAAGHAQPSGTTQDRRMWLEFIAYDANDKVMYQSGVIEDGALEEYPIGDPKYDPKLCMFRDRWLNEQGEDVHMFWEAVKKDKTTSKVVPYATVQGAQHLYTCSYTMPGRQQPARVAMRMRMRPVGVDVLNSLIDSGDLDPAVIGEMPTFTLQNTLVEWHDGDVGDTPGYLDIPITCP
jgi:hypothetical protein